jgi:hypothetical protein
MTSFDPLDLEILERALDAAQVAVRGTETLAEFDTDEELEIALRRELIEIACCNGISDAETMRDLVLAKLWNDSAAKEFLASR